MSTKELVPNIKTTSHVACTMEVKKIMVVTRNMRFEVQSVSGRYTNGESGAYLELLIFTHTVHISSIHSSLLASLKVIAFLNLGGAKLLFENLSRHGTQRLSA